MIFLANQTEENVRKRKTCFVRMTQKIYCLTYTLLENKLPPEEGGGNYFRIRIEQSEIKSISAKLMLTVTSFGFTETYNRALELYQRIYDGKVMPEHLLSIMDDFYYEEE